MATSKIKNFLNNNAFIVSLIGLGLTILSAFLMVDDVMSTAETLYVYMPSEYGVIVVMTAQGSYIAGTFVTVSQIATILIWTNNEFDNKTRWSAFFAWVISMIIDNWTDIALRSSYFTGDIAIATISTLWFYTIGSELLSGIGLLLFTKYLRKGYSQAMFFIAKIGAFFSVQKKEWKINKGIANKKEDEFINSLNRGNLTRRNTPTHQNQGYSQRGQKENKSNKEKKQNQSKSNSSHRNASNYHNLRASASNKHSNGAVPPWRNDEPKG